MIEKFYANTSAWPGPWPPRPRAAAIPWSCCIARRSVRPASCRCCGSSRAPARPPSRSTRRASARASCPTGAPTARQYGQWLLEAIDALGIDRFHLAAHHTGTHFAAEIAAAAPRAGGLADTVGHPAGAGRRAPGLRADIGAAPADRCRGRLRRRDVPADEEPVRRSRARAGARRDDGRAGGGPRPRPRLRRDLRAGLRGRAETRAGRAANCASRSCRPRTIR